MKYEWLKFPQVADVFDEAAEFARNDKSSVVSEWHIMLSLLRFDSVWDRFSRHEELKDRLFAEAAKESDGKGGDEPRPEPEFLKELFGVAEKLRKRSGAALPQPHHFLLATLSAGTAGLRQLAWEFDLDDSLEEDEEGESDDAPRLHENRHVPKRSAEALARYTVELVAAAKARPERRLSGRRTETEAVMRTLLRSDKCCPLLVGRPGVGKTAVVELLAQRIADGDVPEVMKECRIYSLNTGSLIAGASFRGQYEGRLRAVVDSVKRQKNGILFVDEVHALLTSGTNSGDALTAGNILKPELASGELKFIGATTNDEYHKFIELDGAMARRFTPVTVREPGKDECLEMLRNARPALEKHYAAKISDAVLTGALELACRCLAQRALPDKVFDVLNEAAADQLLNGTTDAALAPARVEAAAARLGGLKRVPKLDEDTLAPFRTLGDELKSRVFGQNAAVDALVRAVKLAESGLKIGGRGPRGAFFFNGPTGGGKTELARQLAESLQIPLVKFNMSEYSSDTTVARFVGSAPGLVGYEQGGQLVNAVRENPHCVLLLDEIEKAHVAIHRLLLQVMDAGILTDGRGVDADFKAVYLIMTGNVRAERKAATLGFGGEVVAHTGKPELKGVFPPEFRARLTAAIEFAALSKVELGKVVDAKFAILAHQAREKGVNIRLDDTARAEFVRRAEAEEAGARPVIVMLEEHAALPLAELLVSGKAKKNLKLAYRNEGFQYV